MSLQVEDSEGIPLLTQGELTCEAVVGGLAMKALIDMGKSVYLMREERYKALRNNGWMGRPDIKISQTDKRNEDPR